MVLLYPLPGLSNSPIAEWARVILNGLGSCLFVYGGLQPAVLVGSEICCLDGETGHRACTKNPFWYCHWHIQESRPNAENLFPLKSCRLLLRLKCIFSHVVGVFHVVYCNDKKKKCSSEYVMKDMSSSLHKSDYILATESHKVYTADYQYYGCTSYIHPSPKVMADFSRHKNQHDALSQFTQFLVDVWNVCKW